MVKKEEIIRCVIAEYPMVLRSAVHGLKEMIGIANQIAPANSPKLDVTTCQLHSRSLRHKSDYGVVILPPCLSETPPSLLKSSQSLAWLKHCHQNGALICSVCSGNFMLAETGLLDGRSATTHWTHKAEFEKRFPLIGLQFDRLIDEHDDVITAGGLMAWTDLGLHLINHFQGAKTMIKICHLFLLEPGVRQQKYHATFVPNLNHEDSKILKTQKMMQERLARRWSIATLSEQVGLTERTFLRRFKRSTNLNPTQYLQQLRIAEARKILENSSQSIEQIANDVGYNDTAAFSRVFKQIVGLPAGGYRRRYSLG